MKQVQDFGDDRNKGFCVYCGSPSKKTRDHIPSRVLLDEPFPKNLPVAHSCAKCNNGFSPDEEYFACLMECIQIGEVNPDRIEREKIAKTLRAKPALVERIGRARKEVDGEILWDPEPDPVASVVLKLARGHAAFENNEPRLDEPEAFQVWPLQAMDSEERELFENGGTGDMGMWPEVGSRAMSRLLIGGDETYKEGWLLVQEGRYRYKVSWECGLRVQIVIREYLACEVVWN